MALNYGVLKGTVAGHLRDADDDHYQILVHSGKAVWRVACNVKSSAPNAPSTVLFLSTTSLPDAFASDLQNLQPGFKKLPGKPDGVALDFVRSGIVKTAKMRTLAPDAPGENNDLKDLLEAAVVRAMEEEGSCIYALGSRWGPEPDKPDQYFRFVPGEGVHDIHMNQGNGGKYKKDNGIYQDGALLIEYPGDKWKAFFIAFQSQTFQTDENGNPIATSQTGTKASKHAVAKKKPVTRKSRKRTRG